MKRQYILLFILSIQLLSCRKWLDVKSNIADVTPSKLEDYQGISDADATMNSWGSGLAITGTDNYYVTYATWQARAATERNGYTWAPEIYEGATPQDWIRPFKAIINTNIMLEGIASIPVTPSNTDKWNNVKGTALFVRSFAFFNLSQAFAPSYNATTATKDLGIPLRLNTDVNEVSVRATVQETYEQMINDLTEAAELLPVTPAYPTRPSKPSAYGLLAKIYLIMGNYTQSFTYADKALALYNSLIDFNTLNAAATNPTPAYPGNKEVVYYSVASFPGLFANTSAIIDSTLYQSYAVNDLRKTILYKLNGTFPQFRAAYTGTPNSFFSGIGTNELYLLRAETNARLDKPAAAMTDLNTLLLRRWKSGTFVPLTATNATDALTKVLTERRKELPFTGTTRWEDLRRLNTDTRFAKTLTRQLNGITYTLPPNDKRYTLPIPDEEIRLSGIQQNPR